MYEYAQLIFSSSPGNWLLASLMYISQELKKALSLAWSLEKSDGEAGLILCNPHRNGDGAPDLGAGAACMFCCWVLRCLTTQVKISICAAISAILSSVCVIHICISDSAILERLSGVGFTVMGVVGGSSSVWYSKDPGSEELSAWKIPILLELAPVQKEYSTVRATCLSPWELLLGVPSRAGREILSVYYMVDRGVQTWQRYPQRIPVPGGCLNTILSTLSVVSTIR